MKKNTSKLRTCGLLSSILYTLFLFGITIAIYTIIVLRSLPTIDILLDSNKDYKQILHILYNDNYNIIKTYNNPYEDDITYDEISPNIIKALIATEDKRFFTHTGIDVIGIIRAFTTNIKYRKIAQGGSTITQQLAKMLLEDSSRTFIRKFKEMLLAFKIEKYLTKQEIITFYLNKAYFGAGRLGIKSASQFYFNKSPHDVTIEEAAVLVGLLKAPSRFAPTKNENLSKARAFQVLINMQKVGFIESGEVFDYIIPDINYVHKTVQPRKQKNYFLDWINKRLQNINIMHNERELFVETTLDQKIQNIVEDKTAKFIAKHSEQIDKTQLAVVVLNNEGEVLAMLGGKDYDLSPFNRAIYAYRQTGSLFKTIVYLNAFDKGMHKDDIFTDEPIAVKDWYPENFGKKYFGKVTAEVAFNKSLNSVAIQIAEYFGLNNVIETAKKLGLSSKFTKNDLTITLGTAVTNLLEITKAYAIINNGGNDIQIKNIKHIYGKDNKVLFEAKPIVKIPLFRPVAIEQIKHLLYTTVINGTGKNAAIQNLIDKTELYNLLNKRDKRYFIGGKSGSSQNSRDAWFVGFANNLTIGVWFGNDDNTPTKNIMGGTLPAKLWRDIVQDIENKEYNTANVKRIY